MYQLAYIMMSLFRRLILASGADFEQVVCIVKCKILMDNRKSTKKNNKSSHTREFQLLFYGAMSIIFASTILVTKTPNTTYFVTFTFLMMVAVMNLIAEFNTLLFDTRDNTIIIPRPVSEQTFLMSRIIHISSYMLAISVSFSLLPTIASIYKFDYITGLVFFVEIFLSVLFAVFLTFSFYLGLLKFTTGEKFKDIISYFQIAMGILFFGAYQLLPKLMKSIKTDNLFTDHWWMIFIPPTWMAGFTGSVSAFRFDWLNLLEATLSIAMPLFGLWLIIRVLAPGYSRKLGVLEQGDLTAVKATGKSSPRNISAFLARIFARTPVESATIQTIWKLTARDRNFKQTVYPAIGMIFIMLFVMVFRDMKSFGTLAESNSFLFLIYAPFYFLSTLWGSIKISENYKSAWVYQVLPINRPGEILTGTLKVLILQLYVPLFVIANIVTLYVWGINHFFDVVAGFCQIVIVSVLMILITKSDFPFSTEKTTANGLKTGIFTFLYMFVAFGIGGLHFLFIKLHFNMIIVSAVLIILTWTVFRILRRRQWRMIEELNI
jgi:ABC-2 type transport system permease protein